MSVQIRVPGANFSKFVATLGLPHLDLAQDYFLFGGSNAASIANLKPGGAPGVVVGAPVMGAGYAHMVSDTAYIRSGTNSSGPCTFVSVVRQYNGGDYPNFGNYNLGTNQGLNFSTTTNVAFSALLNGAAKATINDAKDIVNFKFMAVTYDGAQVGSMICNAAGIQTASQAGAGAIPAAPCKWGGQFNYFNHDCAMGITFPSALTFTQLAEIYAYAKPFLASRGVTVL
jgi:hypothetical protein